MAHTVRRSGGLGRPEVTVLVFQSCHTRVSLLQHLASNESAYGKYDRRQSSFSKHRHCLPRRTTQRRMSETRPLIPTDWTTLLVPAVNTRQYELEYQYVFPLSKTDTITSADRSSVPASSTTIRKGRPTVYESSTRHRTTTSEQPASEAPHTRTRPRAACTISGCTAPALARTLCHNHYQRWRLRQKGYGRFTSLYVDAAPALEHLEHLRDTGVGLRTLAAASGVSRRALQRLTAHLPNTAVYRNGYTDTTPDSRTDQDDIPDTASGPTRSTSGTGRPTKILRTTADAILAVHTVEPAPSALVPEIGTRRRLQALIALGWPQRLIAHELGIEATNLSRMVNGRCRRVTAARATEVAALYARWEMIPGPSPRARAHAAANYWAPPLAWDEYALDDPDATPYTT